MTELENQLFESIQTFNQQKLEKLYLSSVAQKTQTTLLNFAMGIDNILAAKFLLNQGVELKEPDELGQFPIFVAIDNLQPKYVDLLIKKGVLDIDSAAFTSLRDPVANTIYHAVFFASFKHRIIHEVEENAVNESITEAVLQILRSLLAIGKEKEFNVNIQNMYGATPLHYAAASNENAALLELLTIKPILNIKDNEGKIPLAYALQKHNTENALALIVKTSEEANLIWQKDNVISLTKKSVTLEQLQNFLKKDSKLKGLRFNNDLEGLIYVKEFILTTEDIQLLQPQLLEKAVIINHPVSDISITSTEPTQLTFEDLLEDNSGISDTQQNNTLLDVSISGASRPFSNFVFKRKFVVSLFIYTLFMQKLRYGLIYLKKNSMYVIRKGINRVQDNTPLAKYKLIKAFSVAWSLTGILYQKVTNKIMESTPINITLESTQTQSILPFKLR